ncbi:MAG: 30S ribosomal protein S1 [Syntrophaceae bacterium]|nr:30S ribosomal protein S1 [Syntrophaceae bacterium]
MEEQVIKEENGGEEKSFAELFAESEPERSRMKPGDRVDAVIVKITADWVFIDLGGKHEGVLDRKEFVDKEGTLTVAEGQTIKAYFLSSRNNDKHFTTRVAAGDAGRAVLEDAWRGGIPVEGSVGREVKGGFEVRLAGDTRAFCPLSQMALYRVNNAAEWVGQRLSFKIIEFSERGRNIVVSHKAILAEEQDKVREQLKEALQVGQLVKGTIVSLQKFGAFVDLGGIQGLIPISEVAWEHIADIKDRLSVGQEVEAVILKLDWEANKISLSLRSNLPDPWNQAINEYPEGSTLTGTVVRLTKFGAFVTLMPGVDGLIHISRIGRGKRISHPSEILGEGQEITVKVEKIDREGKRISLAPLAEVEEEQAEEIEDFQQYVGKAASSFGSFGDTLRKSMDDRSKRD